jgi:hypothetical protein
MLMMVILRYMVLDRGKECVVCETGSNGAGCILKMARRFTCLFTLRKRPQYAICSSTLINEKKMRVEVEVEEAEGVEEGVAVVLVIGMMAVSSRGIQPVVEAEVVLKVVAGLGAVTV